MIPLFMIILSMLYAAIFGLFTFAIIYSKEEKQLADNTSISIIVAVRNEIDTIAACVEALIQQSYPVEQRQIIIVDDGSTDGTSEKLDALLTMHPSAFILKSIQHSSGNKKLALQKAIEASIGEILLFTDADCIPHREWAETITTRFSDDTGLVAGFSPLIHTNNKFLNGIFRLDSLNASLYAAAGILLNFPLTVTGRNLAFRRVLFYETGGYRPIMHSISGDDDLFMHQVHARTNWKLRYIFQPESIVPSLLTISIGDFFHQKQRHISASKYYPHSRQLLYALIHGINFSLYGFFGYTIVFHKYFTIALLTLGIKYLIDYMFLAIGAKRLSSSFQLFHFTCWELISLTYHCLSGIRAFIRPVRWNRS